MANTPSKTSRKSKYLATALLACWIALSTAALADITPEQQKMYDHMLDFPSLVKGGDITPIWTSDGSRFIYRSARDPEKAFFQVDVSTGKQRPFFDVQRLRAA